jgi:hypothetical protein
LDFEAFAADPRAEYARLLKFLLLDPWEPPYFKNYSYTRDVTHPETTLKPETREYLEGRFKLSNRRLRVITDEPFSWIT